jgi:hypothetical protein
LLSSLSGRCHSTGGCFERDIEDVWSCCQGRKYFRKNMNVGRARAQSYLSVS